MRSIYGKMIRILKIVMIMSKKIKNIKDETRVRQRKKI
jgi:hypothetical protein